MEKPSSGNSGFVLGKGGVHHNYNRWLTGVFFLCKHPHWGPLSREELQPCRTAEIATRVKKQRC